MAAAAGRRDADVIALRPLTLMGLDDGVARNLGLACRSLVWRRCRWRLSSVRCWERGGDYRLYRFVRATAGENAGARRLLPRLMLASLIGALIRGFLIKSSSG